jgi:C-terminal processing protease CtpA/Prc
VTWGVVQGTNIGYVYAWDWWTYATRDSFYNAINNLRRNHNVRGLVIDFRMNGGGYGQRANGGLSQLFGFDPTSNMSVALRNNPTDRMSFSFSPATWLQFTPTTDPFDRPIALLIGPGCQSAGDWNAFRMRFHPMVRLFGKPTNGGFHAGTYTGQTFSDRWFYEFPRNVFSSNRPREGHLIHRGVRPHEEVWLTRDGVARGEDDVVKRALAWIDSLATDVDELAENLPQEFGLQQNYPNPFNPSTRIKYQLPIQSHVTLKVYNLLGQEVATLVDGVEEPGYKSVRWDASGVASGVYFSRLESGGSIETKKLLLLR